MKDIDKAKPVLVSGASGYLASWVVKLLLDEGIDVHATVRNPSDTSKVEHLDAIARQASGQLKIFKADLLDAGSFDIPMAGCELVIHTASPFFITGIKDPENELVRPAKEGTRNVLETANKTSTVERVVLTSSVVAMYGDNADIAKTAGGIFTEKDWNETSSANHQPYPFSKTVAEKEAWTIAEGQDRWDLLTINPGWILGPSLSKRNDSLSIATMIEFGDGTYKSGVPNLWMPIVDVRDVAKAHLKAGYTPEAKGRHIVNCGEANMIELAKILRKNFGDGFPFPRREAPKFLFWLLAPMFGRTRKYVSRNVGIPIKLDNAYSKTDLNMTYIPIEQTIKDHFQQLLDDGLVVKA